MKSSIKNISGVLLLSFFLAYLGSVTLFYHQHEVNGKALFHSHPYWPFSEENPVNHHHTSDQLVIISFLTNFVAFAVAAFIIKSTLAAIFTKPAFAHDQRIFRDHKICFYQLRAPPAACFQ